MSEVGVRATFFLTSGYCRERAEFLKEEEVRDLAERGFDFGTHGATHRPLRSLSAEDLRTELTDSKKWLEDTLSAPVDTMSLPAGQGGKEVRETAFASGYRLIGNSYEAGNRRLVLPGELNRFAVLKHHETDEVLRLASASPAYIWRRRMRAAALWLPKKIMRSSHRTRPEA
jgi:peptidoglycan/xylan/chitin deacetylase (PgdA/CDA1 family)